MERVSNLDNRWSLQDLVKSDYSITVVGGASGGRGGPFNVADRLLFIEDTTLKKESNLVILQ